MYPYKQSNKLITVCNLTLFWRVFFRFLLVCLFVYVVMLLIQITLFLDSLSPSGSSNDLDVTDSPRRGMSLRKPDRSRTPSREREKALSRERLLDLGESNGTEGRRTPDREIKSKRERTISEMSSASEAADMLDVSLTSIDGTAFSQKRRLNYGRTVSETSVLSAAHSQLFISASSEDSDPYEYTTKMLDEVIFGLPLGLQPDTALEAVVCSCNQCVKCSRYLYDEEILAGWTADDSTFTTTWVLFESAQVPRIPEST